MTDRLPGARKARTKEGVESPFLDERAEGNIIGRPEQILALSGVFFLGERKCFPVWRTTQIAEVTLLLGPLDFLVRKGINFCKAL